MVGRWPTSIRSDIFSPGSRTFARTADKTVHFGQLYPIISFTQKKLQHEFKHAADFGFNDPQNKVNLSKFAAATNEHVSTVGISIIKGHISLEMQCISLPQPPEYLYGAAKDLQGNLVTAWRPNAQQAKELLKQTGKHMVINRSIDLFEMTHAFSTATMPAQDFAEKFLALRREFIQHQILLSEMAQTLMEHLFWPTEGYEPDPEVFDATDGHIDEEEFRNQVNIISLAINPT